MRVRAALWALTLSVSAFAASAASIQSKPASGVASDAKCRHAGSYLADKSGVYRGDRLAPKKLTELPAAKGYMAVVREIDGCDAPLTVVEYRQGPRR